MGRPIELLAQTGTQTRRQDPPAEVLDRAKLVLLDTLGVILAGSEQPELRAMRAAAASWPGRAATILARGFPAAAPATTRSTSTAAAPTRTRSSPRSSRTAKAA